MTSQTTPVKRPSSPQPDSPSLSKKPSPQPSDSPSVPKKPISKMDLVLSEHDHETLIKLYFIHAFPASLMFKWLNYGPTPTNNFTHREFSFTTMEDVYIRYQSFENLSAFKDRLQRVNPNKIDIGAIYTSKPSDKKFISESAFIPIAKEFVLDIDLTDYDIVRTCCSEAVICNKCWQFITVAMKILNAALAEDFGFEHILWVYSGRRGVHAWVCDERARSLSNESRRAIVNYLDVLKGTSGQSRRSVIPSKPHPSLVRAMATIQPSFNSIILNDMNLFSNVDKAIKLLSPLLDDELQIDSLDILDTSKNSTVKFQELNNMVKAKAKEIKRGPQFHQLQGFEADVQALALYPRLDVNVSIHLNHLLKAPFCIHPKSRRICVPIDFNDVDNFDPFKVPTDHQIISSLDLTSESSSRSSPLLEPYLGTFRRFIADLPSSVSTPKTLDF